MSKSTGIICLSKRVVRRLETRWKYESRERAALEKQLIERLSALDLDTLTDLKIRVILRQLEPSDFQVRKVA